MFSEYVGEPVDSHNLDSIKTGLEKLIKNYDSYDNIEQVLPDFSWGVIAKKIY